MAAIVYYSRAAADGTDNHGTGREHWFFGWGPGPQQQSLWIAAGAAVQGWALLGLSPAGTGLVSVRAVLPERLDWLGLLQLYAARQEAAQAKQDLSQLGPDQQRMERLEAVRQEIDVKNQQLQTLSAKNFPWYSVLVHFGSMTTEGAWLDGLQLEDGDVLQIKGQAVSFEALADYIKAFEQDRDFFPQGPVLKSSSVDKDIVSFQLSLHL